MATCPLVLLVDSLKRSGFSPKGFELKLFFVSWFICRHESFRRDRDRDGSPTGQADRPGKYWLDLRKCAVIVLVKCDLD